MAEWREAALGNPMHDYELVSVDSGATSMRSKEYRQTFHPGTGPMEEARVLYVDQQRLVERALACEGEFVIWDVGFGAAANAIAAVNALSLCNAKVRLHSFDKTTGSIEFALQHAAELGYVVGHEKALRALVSEGHATLTHGEGWIEWRLHVGDFRDELENDGRESPHAIFYDPYSPSVNGEMWTLEIFTRLRQRMHDDTPCLWTNYTRSTAVRVTLLLAGFYVGEGWGIGEKEMTTIASNDLGLIERPFDKRWLERVSRSSNAAPLRSDLISQGPIPAEDFARLKECAQFSGAE